jgi:ketosteroid isomerase-like protein
MQDFADTREPEWLRPLFSAIDASDSGRFCAYLTDDAVFRFGNAPPVQGRSAIEQAVSEFFSSIQRSRHRLGRVWSTGTAIALEGFVTYTRLDGSEVTLPFADTMVSRGDRLAEYNIYIDIAPLYAPQR